MKRCFLVIKNGGKDVRITNSGKGGKTSFRKTSNEYVDH